MHVADLEARPVAVETAGPERGEAALVGQFGQRVDLVHELAQLRAPEEVAHHGGEGLRVDQLRGRHPVEADVEEGHALLDEALGAGEPDAALVGEELADGADAAAAEVVDVVEDALAAAEAEEVGHRDEEVVGGDDALVLVHVEAELLVDLVAADTGEVVLLGIEEEALQQGAGVGHGRGVAGAEAAVDVLQRLLLVVRGILAQRLDEEVVVRGGDAGNRLHAKGVELGDGREGEGLVGLRHDHFAVENVVEDHLVGQLGLVDGRIDLQPLDVVELLDDGLVGGVADGAEEGRGQELATAAAAVEIDVEEVVGVELDLHPGAAVGNDAEAVERFAVEVQVRLEADAGRAVELAHDDALGAVDHEGAAQRHHRQLAHVDALLLRPRLVGQGEGDVERGAEGLPVAKRFEGGLLGLADFVLHEVERELLVVALDRKDLAEDRLQAGRDATLRRDLLLEELPIGVQLDLDQVRGLDGLLDLAKIQTFKFLGSC